MRTKTTEVITVKGNALRINKFKVIEELIYEPDPITNRISNFYRTINKELLDSSNFTLSKVTQEELDNYRANNIPSFVLKENGLLYYTTIPETLSFISLKLLGNHSCSTCHRQTAACDKEGGCAKVREGCRGIEKYPWIIRGYETFNVMHDCFVVVECQHKK